MPGSRKFLEKDYLCYALTSILSFAKGVKFARYGYNREHEKLRQINLAILIGQNTMLPAYYRSMPSSISALKTLSLLLLIYHF
jgi:transposase